MQKIIDAVYLNAWLLGLPSSGDRGELVAIISTRGRETVISLVAVAPPPTGSHTLPTLYNNHTSRNLFCPNCV